MSVSDKKSAWQAAVAKNIARSPERSAEFKTTSNIELERCFTPAF